MRKPEDPVDLEILLERSVDRKDYRHALELIARASGRLERRSRLEP